MSSVNSPSIWDEIYQDGRAGWDLGRPAPVFQRLLEARRFKPGRLLVICAGRGHDARLFARHGFEVTAIDFSGEAVKAMRGLADPEALVEIHQADLFDLPASWEAGFDYVLEYTCFCAIDPQRREDYAERVARLLKPGGVLIALAFPVSSHSGGPPFAVSPADYVRRFRSRGFTLIHRETPPDSVPQRRDEEELVILRKGGSPETARQ